MITGYLKSSVVGEQFIHKDKRLTGAQTDTVLWDPAAGKGISLDDFTLLVTAQGRVTVYVGTTPGTDNAEGNRLVDGIYPAGGGENKSGLSWVLGKNQNIYITTTAGDIDIILNGTEQ